MKITTLGTGWPLPSADRAGAANLVEAGGQRFLVDTGRGVLMRLAAAGSGMGQVTAVLLTHLHSDHVNDFNDVVTTHWIGSFAPAPLKVIGPPGTQAFVDRTLAMLEDDICWRMDHHDDLSWRPDVEVTEVTDGVAFESGGVRVLYRAHRPPARAPDRRLPLRARRGRGGLRGGHRPLRGPRPPGRRGRRLRPDRVPAVRGGGHPRATPAGHPRLPLRPPAGRADRARGGVGTLVLTHMVPPPVPGTEDEWVAEVAEHFAGTIVLADDLTAVEVPGRG